MPIKREASYIGLAENAKLRYDIIDRDPLSQDFFEIVEFPEQLTSGKNVFKFRGDPDTLVDDSRIHIEILDYNGDPIYYEVLNYLEKDGVRVLSIWIYPDTPEGRCTFYLAGRVAYDPETDEKFPFSVDQNSDNFKDLPNLLWTRNSRVAPGRRNNSEIIFIQEPQVSVKEVVKTFSEITDLPTFFRTISGSSGENGISVSGAAPAGGYSTITTNVTAPTVEAITAAVVKTIWPNNATVTTATLSKSALQGSFSAKSPAKSAGTATLAVAMPSTLAKAPAVAGTTNNVTTAVVKSQTGTSNVSSVKTSTVNVGNSGPGGTTLTALPPPSKAAAQLMSAPQSQVTSVQTIVFNPPDCTTATFTGFPLTASQHIGATVIMNRPIANVENDSWINSDGHVIHATGNKDGTGGGNRKLDCTYVATIVEIENSTTCKLHPAFDFLSGRDSKPTDGHHIVDFQPSAVTMSYWVPQMTNETENSMSFANVILNNIEPATGDVYKVKTQYKLMGAPGDYIDSGDTILEKKEVLIDTGSNSPDLLMGVTDMPMGTLTSQDHIDKYWNATDNFGKATFDNDYSGESAKLESTTPWTSESDYMKFRLDNAYNPVLYANTEYSFKFFTKFVETASMAPASISSGFPVSSMGARIDVYMSGSKIHDTKEHFGAVRGAPLSDSAPAFTNAEFGEYLGTIEMGTGTDNVMSQISFVPYNTERYCPIFILRKGKAYIKNIQLSANIETGFSPNYTEMNIRIPTDAMFSPLAFKFQYLDYTGTPSTTETFAQGAVFDGDNNYIEGTGLITGSMNIGNAVGTGFQMAGVSSAFLRTVGYEGFTSASAGSGSGFMMYSGSVLSGNTDDYAQGGVGLDIVENSGSFLTFNTSGPRKGLKVRTDQFYFGSDSTFISGANGNIEITSSNFHLQPDGDVILQGTITAEAGGTIGGATINSHSLAFDPHWEISSSANTADPVSFISSSRFKVSAGGAITASSILLSGGKIGGLEIGSDFLKQGSTFRISSSTSANDPVSFISSSKFKVNAAGVITGSQVQFTGGDIAGWIIKTESLDGGDMHVNKAGFISSSGAGGWHISASAYNLDPVGFISSSAFKVSADGRVTASAATIEGKITATSGEIGGAAIGATSLAFAPYWKIQASDSTTNPGSFISSSKFKVRADGVVTASSILLSGGTLDNPPYWKIDNKTAVNLAGGFISSSAFKVSPDGKVTGSNVLFSGGKIAGWTIANTQLSNTGVILSSSYGLKINDGTEDNNDFVEMRYVGSSDWGISGKADGKQIFQLGSTNKIAGWTFTNESFDGGKMHINASGSISSSNWQISSSTENLDPIGFISSSNFKVSARGRVTASDMLLEGGVIQAPPYWKIDRSTDNTDPGSFISSSKFKVRADGTVTASSILLSGGTLDNPPYWKIDNSTTLTHEGGFISSSRFKVSPGGRVTGSLVKFDGGKIAGWELSEDYLRSIRGNQHVYVLSDATALSGTHQAAYPAFTILDQSNYVMVSMGNIYKNNTNTGFALFSNYSTNEKLMEVSKNMSTNALTAQIAGWNFDANKLTGGNMIIHKDGTIKSSGFISNQAGSGFILTAASGGFLEVENAKIRGTLSTAVFEKESVNAVGGQLYVANSTTFSESISATAGFNHPGAAHSATDTTMSVANVTGFTHGEIVSLKKISPTGFVTEYMQIDSSSRIDKTSETNFGGFLYVTRSLAYDGSPSHGPSGSLGGTPGPAQSYTGSQVLVSTGKIGTGFIRLNANPNDPTTPYIDIVERTGSGIYSIDNKARLGDLSGITDTINGQAVSGFGLYTSNAFLKGGIVATYGAIGGFGINTTTISSSNNNLILRDSGQITGSTVKFDGGDIGGWLIRTESLDGGDMHINKAGFISSSTNWQISASTITTDPIGFISSSAFKVSVDGRITSSNMLLTGGTIDASPYWKIDRSTSTSDPASFISSSKFKVRADGVVTMSAGLIEGPVDIGNPGLTHGGTVVYFEDWSTYASTAAITASGNNPKTDGTGVGFYAYADHGELSFVTDAADSVSPPGKGTLLRIGNDADNDMARYVGNQLIPINSQSLYEVEIRWREVADSDDDGIAYAGILTYAPDGETVVNKTGGTSLATPCWFTATAENLTTSWRIDKGYFKGFAKTGNGGEHRTKTDPGTVHESATNGYFTPAFITSYNNKDGQVEIDYIKITDFGSAAGSTRISGDAISTGKIQSNNYTTTSGSEINLTTGTIKFGGSSDPKFAVNEFGAMTASAGTIATWKINPNSLSSGNLNLNNSGSISSSNWHISSSNNVLDPVGFISSSAFKVRTSGEVTASDALITGDITCNSITANTAGEIAGWTIDSEKFLKVINTNQRYFSFGTTVGGSSDYYDGRGLQVYFTDAVAGNGEVKFLRFGQIGTRDSHTYGSEAYGIQISKRYDAGDYRDIFRIGTDVQVIGGFDIDVDSLGASGININASGSISSSNWHLSGSANNTDPVGFISSSAFKVSADGRVTASGALITGNSLFEGEVKIATTIEQSLPAVATLKGHWEFGAGTIDSGAHFKDTSGNGYDGFENSSGQNPGTWNATGGPNGQGSWDSNPDIEGWGLLQHSAIADDDYQTFTLWYKPYGSGDEGDNDGDRIISRDASDYWALLQQSDTWADGLADCKWYFQEPSVDSIVITDLWKAGEWHYIAMNYDYVNNFAELYVYRPGGEVYYSGKYDITDPAAADSNLQRGVTIACNSEDTAQQVSNYNDDNVKGQFADIRYYNGTSVSRVLNRTEINALYQVGTGSATVDTLISGDGVSTGKLTSTNWNQSAGSQLNLDAGTVKLGGWSAPAFAVNAAGAMTASSGTVGGWTLGASTLTGGSMVLTNTGKIETSADTNTTRIIIDGSSDPAEMKFYSGSTQHFELTTNIQEHAWQSLAKGSGTAMNCPAASDTGLSGFELKSSVSGIMSNLSVGSLQVKLFPGFFSLKGKSSTGVGTTYNTAYIRREQTGCTAGADVNSLVSAIKGEYVSDANDSSTNFRCGVIGNARMTHASSDGQTAGGYFSSDEQGSGTAYSVYGASGIMHNVGEIQSQADLVAYASSDRRMKDNILVIENPIEKIKQIRGVTFDWNEKGPDWTKQTPDGQKDNPFAKKHDVGVIAQEIQKVLPEVVHTRTKKSGFKGMLAVKYEKIVPLLIEGIKEQQNTIESLEARIKKLENK